MVRMSHKMNEWIDLQVSCTLHRWHPQQLRTDSFTVGKPTGELARDRDSDVRYDEINGSCQTDLVDSRFSQD